MCRSRFYDKNKPRAMENFRQNALVSVIIPTRNSARIVMRALRSVWKQDYNPLEIIIVDDNSTDSTVSIIRNCLKFDVKLIELKSHSGASAARNAGIARSSGEFIAFLDSDDEWLPNKITKQMILFQNSPELVLVSCGADIINHTGEVATLITNRNPPVTGRDAWKTLLAYSFIATPCVIARRSAIIRAGCFDPTLSIAEDQDMWIRIACAGEIGLVNDTLALIHERPESLTKSYPRGDIDYTMPMICKNIERMRLLLNKRDIRRILGHRHAITGKHIYPENAFVGAFFLLKSALLGNDPFSNLAYIIAASPIARIIKKRFFLSQKH